MDKFKKSAKRKIQEAIYAILNDADFEVKRHPEQEKKIKEFCEGLMDANDAFFEGQKEEDIEI